MSRGVKLTWDDLPEYPADEDIGAVVLGPDRKREFEQLATLREIDGMPKIDPFWGGRPKWLVKQFIEADQVAVSPAKHGAKGEWNESRGHKLPA
jgi:hypothetical protein